MRGSWILVVFALTGCMEPGEPPVVTGDWGGQHIGMMATADQADLEYDCAAGKIFGPITPDGLGRFTATGQHYPGHGGPAFINEEQVKRPARYTGMIRGDRMTLTVILTDTNETIGTFTLIRGQSPFVFKCQ